MYPKTLAEIKDPDVRKRSKEDENASQCTP